MIFAQTTLILLLSTMLGCGLGARDQFNKTEFTSFNKEEQLAEQQIQSEIVTFDENGRVEKVEGLVFADDIEGKQDLKDNDKIRDLYQSDENAFDFAPPEGFDAEFSEPVMISGASLFLTPLNGCRWMTYNTEEPRIQELFTSAANKEMCGNISIQYCIKLVSKNDLNKLDDVYIETPSFELEIPCSDYTFTDFSIDILEEELRADSEQAAVRLNVKSGVVEYYITNTPDCTDGGEWKPVKSKKVNWGWEKNNDKVYAKFKDVLGTESTCVSDSVSVEGPNAGNTDDGIQLEEDPNLGSTDNSPPNANGININAGAAYANSVAVTLGIDASDANEMYVTNTSGCSAGGTWEAYNTSKAWTLGQTNSTATVYIKYRDAAGNESSCINDTIIHDNVAPSSASIVIDSNASHTNTTSVNLTLAASGASEMYITNTGSCTGGGVWESYATSKAWTLGQTNAVAHVYVKYRDQAGNESPCINDAITHDTIAPSSPSLTIGTGNYPSAVLNTLFPSASGANEMYITNTSGCGSGGTWELYGTTRTNWSLGTTNALTNVYIKYRDTAGNESSCVSDSITHDNTAPTDPGSVNDGVSTTVATDSPSISWSASSDAVSSIDYYEVSIGTSAGNDNTKAWTNVGNVTSTSFNDLSLVAGSTYYANVRAVDVAGNTSNDISGNGFFLAPTVSAIDRYEQTSCALFTDGTTKCWGTNTFGELGYGDTSNRGDGAGEMGTNLPSINLGTGRTSKQISVGSESSCAILDNDTVKCWGQNSRGELGYGDITTRGDSAASIGNNLATVNLGTGRTAKSLKSRNNRVCVILDNDNLKCWGFNPGGSLGLGDTDDRGDGASEMGDNLPTLDLGSGRTVIQVETLRQNTCALLDNNTVKCWGKNDNGELGLGDISGRGNQAGEMGDNLATVDLGSSRTAKQISSGRYHTCAILDNDTVKCWGTSTFGEIGYGDIVTRGDGAGEMGNNLPTVDLGTGRTAKQISAGKNHTCAILDNDTVKCWGENVYGGLGYGDTNNRGDGAGEMGDNLPTVDLGTGRTALSITAGTEGTCARLDNLEVKCWGRNTDGMLGYGDLNDRGDGSGEMGDNLPNVDL